MLQPETCGIVFTKDWIDDVSQRTQETASETRTFRAPKGPGGEQQVTQQLFEFFQHLNEGRVRVLGARDFAYQGRELEREVWLLDTTQALSIAYMRAARIRY